MRKRFERQTVLGLKLIEETPLPSKSRDDVPALAKALLVLYTTPKYNDQVFSILEDKILKGKKKTGRNGLNLWQIFVLAQFRLALNIDYDRLHFMAYSDSTLRQLLGIETETGFKRIEFGRQRIVDNAQLLDDTTLIKINEVIVGFGHNIFKKKETEALSLKTDSFVVESTVHFPTDYNLLWDATRKALDIVTRFTNEYPKIAGWRKSKDWFRSLKNYSRNVGRVSAYGGKNKELRLKEITKQYLAKATSFRDKLNQTKTTFPKNTLKDTVLLLELDRFIKLLDKHLDLVERRILKGEKISHKEKLFSIFEQYTEWINKGKSRPNVELGKMLSITTDQYGLIVDGYIMEHEKDSQIVKPTVTRLLKKYNVHSWSFDKGYWHKDNKSFLENLIPQLIMPKKGKRNNTETTEEHSKEFKKLKHKHSAVESNINELEHRGLDRCPDKGYANYKRYIAIGITAYNLHRIGKEILKQEKEALRKREKRKLRKSA